MRLSARKRAIDYRLLRHYLFLGDRLSLFSLGFYREYSHAFLSRQYAAITSSSVFPLLPSAG